MIIGLTGTISSGKGTIAEYLKEKGFNYYSLSDELRNIMKERNIELTRDKMQRIGNELRKEQGAGILARIVAKKVDGNAVIDSIRNIEEIAELRKLLEFVLIGVDAPVRLRFLRAKERGRVGEGETLKDFIEKEKVEKSTEKHGQQLDLCLNEADYQINNDSTIEELYKAVDEVLLAVKNERTHNS